MVPPKSLSDVIEWEDHDGLRMWLVHLRGGSYSGLMTRAEAYDLARKEWPNLIDDE